MCVCVCCRALLPPDPHTISYVYRYITCNTYTYMLLNSSSCCRLPLPVCAMVIPNLQSLNSPPIVFACCVFSMLHSTI